MGGEGGVSYFSATLYVIKTVGWTNANEITSN